MARSYTIDWIGGNCPVQAEGHIGDETTFYFRARGRRWHVEISQAGIVIWRHEEPWGEDEFAAGWMPEETAKRFLDQAIKQFWKEMN